MNQLAAILTGQNFEYFIVFMLFASFAFIWIVTIKKANKHWLYLKETEPDTYNYKSLSEWKNKNFGKIDAFANLLIMLIPILIKSHLECESDTVKTLGNNVRKMIFVQYLSVLLFILTILLLALN